MIYTRNFMSNVNITIVGCGNCSSSILQGLEYYKNMSDIDEYIPGLMHPIIGRYRISDIKPVAAFDIDRRKVGKDLSKAIFEQPNCTKKFCDVPILNVEVMKGPVLDGVAGHMTPYFQVDPNQKELSKEEIVSILKERKTDIIISYLPVGSQKATEFWADIALESRCAFINAIPQFIASESEWTEKFRQANLPIIGDDCKSQVGATIVNRALVQMIEDRGGKIVNSWQTNMGGNTDFRNMIDITRLESKKISKTESVKSLIPDKYKDNTYIYAGPNGVIECLSDNKISFMRIDFKIFGNIDCSIDVKLNVEDSPNSGGIIIDAIRVSKICLDKGIGGPIIPACAYYMKHPPEQMRDEDARKQLEEFINGKMCDNMKIGE